MPAKKRAAGGQTKDVATRARKKTPPLNAGLSADLPPASQQGPWLRRCVERWGLAAPFDPLVSEAQWEAYFKERAALEWHTDTVLAEASKENAAQNATAAAAWPFDWPKPALKNFCKEYYGDEEDDGGEAAEFAGFLANMRDGVQRLMAGCKGVPELAQKLAGGLYITEYWVNWCGVDCPRAVEVYARLYSPSALATSIKLSFGFHHKPRMYFAESFASGALRLRGPGDTCPDRPLSGGYERGDGELFNMDLQDSGYQQRRFLGKMKLREMAGHLLGRRGLISERKAFALALTAMGGTAVPGTDVEYAFRVNRRTHKLAAGEESDTASANDSDSDNEAKKNRPSQYADPFDPDEPFCTGNPMSLSFALAFGLPVGDFSDGECEMW